ncbi:MAG: hypothetical protein HFI26_01955 [Lachnospiraceae bacterium]|jgi:hypothetical protein|nr:hypothetical protein [Lachnospiraceae bacterium]
MKKNAGWGVLLTGLLVTGLLAGCGKPKQEGTPVAGVGSETIYLEEALFYTRMLQEQWELAYYDSYGADMWQKEPEFGESGGRARTMEEALKLDVMDVLTEIHLLCAHTEEYGAELTKEEKAVVEKRAKAFMEDNTEAVLEAAGATRESVEQFLLFNEQAAKTAEYVKLKYEPQIDENEAQVGKLTYCLFATTGTFDAQGNQTPFTEEELACVQRDAEQFAGRAEELGDITAAGAEISHTVIDVYFNEHTDGGAHELVARAAREMETGDVSGVIETQEGYYIVQKVSEYDEEASRERREELEYLAREDYCAELIETWKKETPLAIEEELWSTVRVDGLLTSP